MAACFRELLITMFLYTYSFVLNIAFSIIYGVEHLGSTWSTHCLMLWKEVISFMKRSHLFCFSLCLCLILCIVLFKSFCYENLAITNSSFDKTMIWLFNIIMIFVFKTFLLNYSVPVKCKIFFWLRTHHLKIHFIRKKMILSETKNKFLKKYKYVYIYMYIYIHIYIYIQTYMHIMYMYIMYLYLLVNAYQNENMQMISKKQRSVLYLKKGWRK